MDTITRQMYLDGIVTHEVYYGQFVDESLKSAVATSFGLARLTWAYSFEDSFNHIPLVEWDGWYGIMSNPVFKGRLKAAGDSFSMSGVVCTLKEAARQVVVENKVAA